MEFSVSNKQKSKNRRKQQHKKNLVGNEDQEGLLGMKDIPRRGTLMKGASLKEKPMVQTQCQLTRTSTLKKQTNTIFGKHLSNS